MPEQQKNNAILYGEIISKCWEDEAYKKRFKEDPESVLTEAGVKIEEGVTYKVIEAPKLVQYVVLPAEDSTKVVQALTKRILNKADQGGTFLPEGAELRVIQDTEDIRHIILPASPKTLTKAELGIVAGGDYTATATNVVAQAEAVAQAVEGVEVASTVVNVVEAGVAAVAGAAAFVAVGVFLI